MAKSDGRPFQTLTVASGCIATSCHLRIMYNISTADMPVHAQICLVRDPGQKLAHGSLGLRQSITQTASRLVHPFLRGSPICPTASYAVCIAMRLDNTTAIKSIRSSPIGNESVPKIIVNNTIN